MILILLFIIFFFSLYFKNRSLAFMLSCILLISILGAFFLGREVQINGIEDLFWMLMIVLLLFFIVSPWRHYYGVREIKPFNEDKLKFITRSLIIINSFVFVIFLTTTITVMTLVTDINEFKYTEGESVYFFYNMLPFPTIYFNLSILIYYFSFFILPLHFYYLYQRRYWLSIICFILSLNIVLYGLTFFSRAVVVQYLLLYSSILYLLYGVMSIRVKRIIRNLFIIIGVISVFYLVTISQRRFIDDEILNASYSSHIPPNAITQDPLIYSYLDYMSQGFYNGYEVLQRYQGEGFKGALTFESLLAFISTPQEMSDRILNKQRIWPDPYWYSFNGFPAYSVYDYGIVGSIILAIIYYVIVRMREPKNHILKLKDLFLIVLLIQIPLMAVFYNQIGGLVIAILLWFPINFYIKYKL